MILLLVIIGGIILFVRSGGAMQAQTTPVINQATGGSLSSALGNKAATPGYFASGNPQYAASGVLNSRTVGTPTTRPPTTTRMLGAPASLAVATASKSRILAPGIPSEIHFQSQPLVPASKNPNSSVVRGAPNVPVSSAIYRIAAYRPALVGRAVQFSRIQPENQSPFFGPRQYKPAQQVKGKK